MASRNSPSPASTNRGHVPRFSFLAVLLLLAACRESRTATTTTDDIGRNVTIPPRVQRIVTLAPNLTELVYAIGAGGRLAGTDKFSDYPADAKQVPKVGDMQPNLERITALKPDVVLASTEGNHPNLGPALAAVSIPMYVVRTDRAAEIPDAMKRLGEILDAPEAAEKAEAIRAALAAQKRTRKRSPRVLFAVWTEPLYVAGRQTFAGDIIELAGGTNAVTVNGWPQFSLEALVANPPDLIVYPQKAVSMEQLMTLRKAAPGLRSAFVGVDDDVFTRPGPRVVQAATQLNAILDAWEARSN
ncbi:MAG TPA: helical backbone metal receptor [Thermoanaerobaculia bacterium]